MTDGLKPVGVELVAEGSPTFTTAVNKAAASLGVLERAGKAAAAGINAFDQVVIGALRRVGELGINALVRAGRELVQFGAQTLEAATQGSQLNQTLDTLGERLLRIIRFNIDPLLNQFDGLVQRTTPAIEGWVAAISREFSQVGQNALTWGENIATQFAQGIYDGAQAVLDALIYIGNLITSWLMPGSPPKLLPDLDDWGREAANVYLQGWTKADFSLFETIGSQIESLLRSQATKNDTNLIPRILGTREAIAQAVAQAREMGQVTAESLDAIYRAAGAVTPEIKSYLASVFQLDFANAGLAAAQDELNRATEKYAALLKPVDAQLARISEAQQQFTEDQELSRLALILKDPNATAAEKRQAQLRQEEIAAERQRRALLAEQAVVVDAAQTKVDAAQDAVAAAQSQYEAERERLVVLTDQNRLIGEQVSLLERLAAAVAKAAGGAKGGGLGVVPLEFEIPPEIQAKIDALKAKVEALKESWANAWAAMVTAMQPITTSIGNMVAYAAQNLGIVLPGVLRNLERSIESLSRMWEDHKATVLLVVETLFGYIWTTITTTLVLISGALALFFRFTEFSWKQFSLLLEGDWAGMWENIKTALADAWVIISDTLTTALEGILLLAGTDLATFEAVWSGIFTNLGVIVQTAMSSVMGFVQPVIDAVLYLLSLLPAVGAYRPPVPGAPPIPSAGANVVSTPASGGQFAANNVSNVNNGPQYNYSPTYQSAAPSPTQDFAAMQIWGAN